MSGQTWGNVISAESICSILRPATPFVMVALEDSFIFGSHFYSSALFKESLRAVILQCFFSDLIADDFGSRCMIIFCKALAFYKDGVPEGGCLQILIDAEIANLSSDELPSHENLASLLILVTHLDMFFWRDEEDPYDWHSSQEFWEDFEVARRLALHMTWEFSERYPGFKRQLELLEDEFELFIRENEHCWQKHRRDPEQEKEDFPFRRLSRVESGDEIGGLAMFE